MRLEFEGSIAEWRSFVSSLQMGKLPAPRDEAAEDAELESAFVDLDRAAQAAVEAAAEVAVEPEPELKPILQGITPEAAGVPFPFKYGHAPKASPPPELTATVSDARRQGAWVLFCEVLDCWLDGFFTEEQPSKEKQQERVQKLMELGTGPGVLGILVMAYELRSLQALVRVAAARFGYNLSDDEVSLVAGTMIQVSHAGFPDLVGTYDLTEKWRRK